jgi:transcriptional regulator with XRE-family HTH domain
MDTDSRIRKEIENAMRQKGMSQAELARRLGVKAQSIHPILKGARGKQPQSLLDILDALDLELTVQPRDHRQPTSTLPPDLETLVRQAGPLNIRPGSGRKPQGTNIRPKSGVSVSDAVSEDREERYRSL